MAQITVQPVKARREFNGEKYVLTKIDYTKEDAEADEAYYQKQGRVTRLIEEDGYWLLYTKLGQ